MQNPFSRSTFSIPARQAQPSTSAQTQACTQDPPPMTATQALDQIELFRKARELAAAPEDPRIRIAGLMAKHNIQVPVDIERQRLLYQLVEKDAKTEDRRENARRVLEELDEIDRFFSHGESLPAAPQKALARTTRPTGAEILEIPVDYEEVDPEAPSEIYIAVARVRCWHCRKPTEVCAFGIPFVDGGELKIAFIRRPKSMPKFLRQMLRQDVNFKESTGHGTTRKLQNNCRHCDSIQGDYYLFSHDDGPFRNLDRQSIQELTIYRVRLDKPIKTTRKFTAANTVSGRLVDYVQDNARNLHGTYSGFRI